MSIKVYEAYRIRDGVDPYGVLWEIQRRGREQILHTLDTLFRAVVDGRAHAEHLKRKRIDEQFKAWFLSRHPEGTPQGVSLLQEFEHWMREECPPELKPEAGVYAVSNEEVFEKAKRPDFLGTERTPGLFDVDMWGRAMFAEQATRSQRNPWALDVSVTLRVLYNRYYLIPYCDKASLVGGSLNFMEEMEELEAFGYWNNTDPPEEVSSKEWEARKEVWSHFISESRWTNYLVLDVFSWETWSEASPLMKATLEALS